MKQILTLVALAFTLLTFAGQQASTGKGVVSKTETTAKQKQSADLKVQCPHYPSFTSSATGADKSSTLVFEKWKTKYPNEYTAYLKIFNYDRKETPTNKEALTK